MSDKKSNKKASKDSGSKNQKSFKVPRGNQPPRGPKGGSGIKPTISCAKEFEASFKPGAPELQDAISVIIIHASAREHWVMHRPIGHHDLEPTDWVLSEAREMPMLLLRKEDPSEGEREKLRTSFCEKAVFNSFSSDAELKFLVEGELLTFEKGEILLEGKSLLDIWKRYEKALRSEGKNPPRKDVLASVKQKLHQLVLTQYWVFRSNKGLSDAALAKYPINPHYRTQKGPSADKPQVSIPELAGKSTEQISGFIIQQLISRQRGLVEHPKEKKKTFSDKELEKHLESAFSKMGVSSTPIGPPTTAPAAGDPPPQPVKVEEKRAEEVELFISSVADQVDKAWMQQKYAESLQSDSSTKADRTKFNWLLTGYKGAIPPKLAVWLKKK